MLYTLHVLVVEAAEITKLDQNYTHACCTVQTTTESKDSLVVPNNMYPRWNQDFHFNIQNPTVGNLHITIRDKDQYKKDMNISYIDIQYSSLPIGQVIDRWYDMIPFDREQKGGRIHLVVQMAPAGTPPFTPSTGYQQQPGYPTAQPGYPAAQPGYPPQTGYPPQPTHVYPQPGYAAPQPGYGMPQPGYGVPQPGYAAPQPGYGMPQPGYAPPQPGYGMPQQTYPPTGYPPSPYGTHPPY